MRFLSLSTPAALTIALLTTGAIIALYFLKLRHRRVLIPSSILWQRVLDEEQARSLWEKLRKILSIALAVTIGLLIAFAAARPEIEKLTGKTARMVIVLDTSPTMLTLRSDGRTRWLHARDAALSLINAHAGGTEFRIADTSGRVDSSFTTNHTEIRALIDRLQPAVSNARFPEVADSDAQVVFISDGLSGALPPKGATRVSVFETAKNVGITAFEIRATPSSPLGYEAFIEVHNFGRDAQDTGITLSGAGKQRITRNVQLAAGQSFTEDFDLSQFEGGAIRAVVRSDGDAFSLDDTAYAYLPIRRKTRTLLVTSGNTYLETVLKLNSLVALAMTTPAEFRDSSVDYDAYIFDRFAPASPPSRPSLIFGAPNATWLRNAAGVVSSPTFTTWLEDHPVMQHVALHDVSVQKAAEINASGLTVVAASGRTPLIVASDRPRWMLLTFDLQSSDFPFHSSFPVFIENAMAWLSREPSALYRTTGVVEVPMLGAEIRSLDGRTTPSRQYLGHTIFEAAEPGLYIATKGDVRQYVAVNLTSRQYSDINRSATRQSSAAASSGIRLAHELWFYMLLAAVVLIAAEWFTYHRRITL
jgi:hypothetical protein